MSRYQHEVPSSCNTTVYLSHMLVSKLIFVSKSLRTDIQITVSFMMTRLRDPDEDDWNNLWHMIQFLHRTHEMALYLYIDDLYIINWWVDASYGVHYYLKGHTNSTIFIGMGCVTTILKKQKIRSEITHVVPPPNYIEGC